jgi:hypothetical protein
LFLEECDESNDLGANKELVVIIIIIIIVVSQSVGVATKETALLIVLVSRLGPSHGISRANFFFSIHTL